MNTEAQIALLTKKIETLISEEPDLFLVEVRIAPTNNIRIFIDGDQGVSIDKLVRYNRSLYKQLEEEQIFPADDFSLEVSSSGLDEPLKLNRQYQKNIGRFVEVLLLDGRKIEAKLTGATETDLLVEEEKGKGKKLEIIPHSIPLDTIKATIIQIKF